MEQKEFTRIVNTRTRVKIPVFKIASLVEDDLNTYGLEIGDELVYSVRSEVFFRTTGEHVEQSDEYAVQPGSIEFVEFREYDLSLLTEAFIV